VGVLLRHHHLILALHHLNGAHLSWLPCSCCWLRSLCSCSWKESHWSTSASSSSAPCWRHFVDGSLFLLHFAILSLPTCLFDRKSVQLELSLFPLLFGEFGHHHFGLQLLFMVLLVKLPLRLSLFQLFLLFLLRHLGQSFVFLVSRLNFLVILKTENVLLFEVWKVIALRINSSWQVQVRESHLLALRIFGNDIAHDVLLPLNNFGFKLFVEFL
jgi:hypothetical protein